MTWKVSIKVRPVWDWSTAIVRSTNYGLTICWITCIIERVIVHKIIESLVTEVVIAAESLSSLSEDCPWIGCSHSNNEVGIDIGKQPDGCPYDDKTKESEGGVSLIDGDILRLFFRFLNLEFLPNSQIFLLDGWHFPIRYYGYELFNEWQDNWLYYISHLVSWKW